MNIENYESYYIGDSCICWSFGNIIDKELNSLILFLYKQLKNSELFINLELLDLVPSYSALAVHYDSLKSDPKNILEKLDLFFSENIKNYNPSTTQENRVTLDVIYNGEDLERVAKLHNLTTDEVIQLHTAAEYQVAMVGFKPHFPYLIGLDPKLETPRLSNPRTVVPKGSVAIGGAQTGIYPEQSPGGWNIIGTTDSEKLKQIKPGDKIILNRSVTL